VLGLQSEVRETQAKISVWYVPLCHKKKKKKKNSAAAQAHISEITLNGVAAAEILSILSAVPTGTASSWEDTRAGLLLLADASGEERTPSSTGPLDVGLVGLATSVCSFGSAECKSTDRLLRCWTADGKDTNVGEPNWAAYTD